MNERITQALKKLFERHRIVFWYDSKEELRDDFESLSLSDVDKIEIQNNEYALKYRILREEPDKKFLLYHQGPQPEAMEDWLLDVQLSHGEFRTDQTALWLSELELGFEFIGVVQDHSEFFTAVKRKESLKRLLSSDDTSGMIRLKMLAVCAGSDSRLDSVQEYLLQEYSGDSEEKYKLIERCNLHHVFWKLIKKHYAYQSDSCGIKDFTLTLFKSSYAMGINGEPSLNSDALVFLKRWKDSRQFESSYEKLSAESSRILGIEQDLAKRSIKEVVDLDYFRLIDQKIISDLVHAVVNRTETPGTISLWIRQRRQSHWYHEFKHLYEAIDFAAQYITLWEQTELNLTSLSDGIKRYTQSLFKLDQYYRKYTYHVRLSGQASLMETLNDVIENLYTNAYLLSLGDRFHPFLEDITGWNSIPSNRQRDFFKTYVLPFLKKDKKVFVLISDALRYEVGEELLSLIRSEDRYSADLDSAISTLPSYTQLGMAALLPNKSITISDNDSATVMVDDQSSQGSPNRQKILQNGLIGKNGCVVSAEDFLKMPREGEAGYRNLFSSNDVVYIYHNRIDAVGDKRESEDKVFEAVEKTLEELVNIIKKLSNANATNMLVTSDHGFIYQNRALDESDFAAEDAEGDKILQKNRRFVIGKGLKEKPGLHKFTSSWLGLSGDVEIQLPRSINRFRLKGAGSRFVHGGATLQEIVIPVLKINKKRQSDISYVDVEIIRGTNSVISSGQQAVRFYQSQPVSEKIQPRVLRAGIFTEEGELISDSHDLIFDFTSENPRERELQVQFILSHEADKANNKEVVLKLEVKHAGTSYYSEYKSLRYTIRRSFTSDFDL
ncbi:MULTISPECIES: BREX-1 system phosphatase PglZ type A [unclassified Oceanispirochaeta]|uniref:BREX-1 system phosphatase PglZ type A n=1 Tax=unclassified Oceanispirochaeta TaxID=2635722 RepID=UPI000E09A00B|nr:BREX-1 system phosphatase PglZ type A [Oceanispirochaeta sp. M1]MBF9015175.1 BREX-1 system phosphatase PglZ type A [Oceanispirochaeta sp. M2]NPD71633.1 BREX-1 system phosphatase PglZ type A [Oceanispirochaeta sp. M1]RDG33200.1 BREX-1 system phosphatase PglZ type A [Oceanispirochaeta sp. M1]